MFTVLTQAPGRHYPRCDEHGTLDRAKPAMAQAREIVENHARADHYGLGDTIHKSLLVDSTGDATPCDMPLEMCPHLADDPKQNNTEKEEQTEPSMSDDSQFRTITVYVPVSIAISEEVAEGFEPERAVAMMLQQVMQDALAEPESVAEHDPMAIVGVSTKTHFEPDDSVWERVLPDPDKEVFGTVSRKPVRAADLTGTDTLMRLSKEFENMLKYLNAQVEQGKLSGLTKVRLVLELDVPEREPAMPF